MAQKIAEPPDIEIKQNPIGHTDPLHDATLEADNAPLCQQSTAPESKPLQAKPVVTPILREYFQMCKEYWLER